MSQLLRIPILQEGIAALVMTALLLQPAVATAPDWWQTHGVTTNGTSSDDFAVANIGQVKTIAVKAAAALNATYPGGVGSTINNLISAWQSPPPTGTTRDDYAAATIGQAKFIAKPFYDRLGLAPPWTSSPSTADDHALINLGQLKALFAFPISNPLLDSDTDGVSDRIELIAGTDPHSISSFPTFDMVVVSGGAQSATAGSAFADPVIYEYTANGHPIPGEVVAVTAYEGATIRLNGTETWTTSLNAQTDSQGHVAVLITTSTTPDVGYIQASGDGAYSLPLNVGGSGPGGTNPGNGNNPPPPPPAVYFSLESTKAVGGGFSSRARFREDYTDDGVYYTYTGHKGFYSWIAQDWETVWTSPPQYDDSTAVDGLAVDWPQVWDALDIARGKVLDSGDPINRWACKHRGEITSFASRARYDWDEGPIELGFGLYPTEGVSVNSQDGRATSNVPVRVDSQKEFLTLVTETTMLQSDPQNPVVQAVGIAKFMFEVGKTRSTYVEYQNIGIGSPHGEVCEIVPDFTTEDGAFFALRVLPARPLTPVEDEVLVFRRVERFPVEVEQKWIDSRGTVGDYMVVRTIRPTRWYDAFNGSTFVGLANDRDRLRIKLPDSLLTLPIPPTVKFGVTGITGTSTSEDRDPPDTISLPGGGLCDVNLVTDASDDDSYSEIGPEDRDWDTTHLSSLNANAVIELHGLAPNPISLQVPVMSPRGKVELVVRVLSETGSLSPAELRDVMKDCSIAREIYAQIGVEVTAVLISGMPLHPTISQLIQDGDLSYTPGDPFCDSGLLLQTLPPVTGNKVPIYYVRSTIGFNPGGRRANGLTFDEVYGDKNGTVVISLVTRTEGTLPHEIAHAVGEDNHRPEASHYPVGMSHLLMRAGSRRFEQNHLDAKRFTLEDESAIKANRSFYVPLP